MDSLRTSSALRVAARSREARRLCNLTDVPTAQTDSRPGHLRTMMEFGPDQPPLNAFGFSPGCDDVDAGSLTRTRAQRKTRTMAAAQIKAKKQPSRIRDISGRLPRSSTSLAKNRMPTKGKRSALCGRLSGDRND